MNNSLNCTQLQYTSINTITISDHKPVYSLFECEAKKINRSKYNKLYESLLKDADRKYNDELPHIKIDKFELNFGVDLLYYDAKQQQMLVSNSGLTRSNVSVLFYDPSQLSANGSLDASNSLKSSSMPPRSCWLSIYPQHKERLAAGASYTVELTTCFNSYTLRRLNRTKKLEDFLIVKCLNGNDAFVTASCTYRPTVIGFSLKCLSQIGSAFDQADEGVLVDVIEDEIGKFEAQLDDKFKTKLRQNTADKQQQQQQLHQQGSLDISSSLIILKSKIEIYNRTLRDLKSLIVDSDPYFKNELSSDYK